MLTILFKFPFVLFWPLRNSATGSHPHYYALEIGYVRIAYHTFHKAEPRGIDIVYFATSPTLAKSQNKLTKFGCSNFITSAYPIIPNGFDNSHTAYPATTTYFSIPFIASSLHRQECH